MNSLLARGRRLGAWLLLAGLVPLFLYRLAFSNLILARGDTFLYFYPYWEAAAAALRAGRLPLWNPHLFMGAPLLANSQMGFFYPLNWPLWLLLPAPYAVTATIVLHLVIAAWGTYWAGRRLALKAAPALLAALLFGLGGYLLAQVEHVNQLQALAWLPWALGLLAGPAGRANASPRLGGRLRRALLLALILSLQLLAGHTQSVFISGVGLGVWLLASWQPAAGWRAWPAALARRFWPLALAALLALGVAAVQLLPTLELAGLSSRAGGLPLNEVLSFSLHPLLLGAALLPGWNESIFTEYVAFLPITAFCLSVMGAAHWRRSPAVRGLLALAMISFLLALGQFNPLNWLIGRLPGFDLFRVPARWLVWYALSMALLAGWGWQQWLTTPAGSRSAWSRCWLAGVALVIGLVSIRVAAPWLNQWLPVGTEAPIQPLPAGTMLFWIADGLLLLLVAVRWRRPDGGRTLPVATLAGVAVILFVAARPLPVNQPTTPYAYFEFRPALARLAAETVPLTPPDRFLSLSNIFFDLGDRAELDAIYADQLDQRARDLYTVVNKQKAVVDPNLPLVFGLHSVDGFDGGILPLAAYTDMTRLLLPAGVTTTDGRLRELLPAVPPARWLDLFNARFIITDKVGDVWREVDGQAVFFDTQLPVTLAPGDVAAVSYVPAYEATDIWILAEEMPGDVYVGHSDRDGWILPPEQIGADVWRVRLPRPVRPRQMVLRNVTEAGAHTVRAVALVDERDGSFQSVVAGAYRLIYSGDVKIYENMDVLPRAHVAQNWVWAEDRAAALALMSTPDFEPHSQVVLQGTGAPSHNRLAPLSQVTISQYDPTRVVVDMYNEQPGVLVLSDAYYPGWQAALDGTPAELYVADGLFRGVMVPAGNHTVIFEYRPAFIWWGGGFSALALLLWLFLYIYARRRPERENKP